MKFTELPLKKAYLIELEHKKDKRGYFARTFCIKEFEAQGLATQFLQCSTSFNLKKGTIRGMHFQAFPYGETKLVRCTKGAIYDAIIDLREASPTFEQWYGVTLSADEGTMLYIPKGFAHGYQVLEDNTEILYMMDALYVPEAAREISAFSYPDTFSWPESRLHEEEER